MPAPATGPDRDTATAPASAPAAAAAAVAAVEHSDSVLCHITRMLMADDDVPFEAFDHCALLAAEQPFLDVLAAPLLPPPDYGRATASAVLRGRKHSPCPHLDDDEGRSSKQPASVAADDDRIVRDMMDLTLQCERETRMPQACGKNKRRQPKEEVVVAVEALLLQCAQAVATDNRRAAAELLRQVRAHTILGGGTAQRVARCFADALEVRLAGARSHFGTSCLVPRERYASMDVVKAYRLYLEGCPVSKISHQFTNQAILKASEKAEKVHIVDYGTWYGMQWPSLIRQLAARPGGPPRLRITGIDNPQPGPRPAERIEEVGQYLTHYAGVFAVPFEFRAMAARWDAVRAEDLRLEEGEVLVVRGLYTFKTLADETLAVDDSGASPRDVVLRTIREMNPDVFVHGVENGSYSAPFFATRFREALLHFSGVFDMYHTNVPMELDIMRPMLEREVMNVVACEGRDRTQRPETCKQWQARNRRAGLRQLPLDSAFIRWARDNVRSCYHKYYLVDEDDGGRWLLLGWKGRILYALSTWKPDTTVSDIAAI